MPYGLADQDMYSDPGTPPGLGRAAIGCSAVGGDSIGRPYRELLWARILRSLRRNLARLFWNQTWKTIGN